MPFKTAGPVAQVKMRAKFAKGPVEVTLSESQIQTAIMNRLRADGWLVVRINSGGMKMGTRYFRAYIIQQLNVSAGLPDVLAMRDGRVLLIEVKDAKGKLTDSQVVFHRFAERFGMQVHVVRDVGELEVMLEGER